MSKNHSRLFIMVGEIFDIYVSQMSKNHLKSFTMAGDIFEIYLASINSLWHTWKNKDNTRKVLVDLNESSLIGEMWFLNPCVEKTITMIKYRNTLPKNICRRKLMPFAWQRVTFPVFLEIDFQ